ncbi:transposase [Chroococcidiopsis sp. FACHB-1243]|uniref:transposase n=1 Tax=Chroococcidiopsis sp. [FACHB-1243] TaxID=2692781 RepID=UPI00177E8210|nr:transposase [Chroococcidiopsis sp. [FACHB-1243]]MBD2309637.1 transposase [Chroococcidiopsis sp. [FACHB-1243]]
MALFPPGKGGGEGVSYGYKGKGILIHSITDANGMPVVAVTTAANGDERQQVLTMLAQIRLATGKRGNPQRRPKTLAADKGYDAKWLRLKLRSKGIRPQIKKRQRNGQKLIGRPIKEIVPRYQQERSFSWFQRKYRRLVVRWERLKACFDAFLLLACSYIWFPKLVG